MTATKGATLSQYQLRLSGFEGPLDVLLRLIEERQMEISDLSLVAVTDGFLAHLEGLEDPPPQLLAEFVGIGSRLLVLKTRALLPRPEVDEPDEDVDDLAAQLREYQRARNLAGRLRELNDTGWRSFARTAPPPGRQVNVKLDLPPADDLQRAFLHALSRQPEEPTIAPIRRIVSISEMAGRLLRSVMTAATPRRFRDLVPSGDRHEVVAGFIAMLSLWSRRELQVEQDDVFGEILIGDPGKPASD